MGFGLNAVTRPATKIERIKGTTRPERKLQAMAALGGGLAGAAVGAAAMALLSGPSASEKAALRKAETDIENTHNFYLHNVLERGNIIVELSGQVDTVDQTLNQLKARTISDIEAMNQFIIGSLQKQQKNIDYLMNERRI